MRGYVHPRRLSSCRFPVSAGGEILINRQIVCQTSMLLHKSTSRSSVGGGWGSVAKGGNAIADSPPPLDLPGFGVELCFSRLATPPGGGSVREGGGTWGVVALMWCECAEWNVIVLHRYLYGGSAKLSRCRAKREQL